MFVTYLLHSYLVHIMLNACVPSRLVSLTLNVQHTFLWTEFCDVTF